MADLTRVPLLIEQLGDEQEEIRDRARRELLDLGPVVVPFLIPVIREDSGYIYQQHEAAWSTMAGIRPVGSDPRKADNDPGPLIAAMADAHDAVRSAAAYALGNFGAVAGAPLLAALADGYVRQAVSESLAKVAGVCREVVPALIQALGSEDWALRSAAARVLVYMDSAVAAPAIPALIPALREEEWTRRLEIIDALYFIGPVATPALVDALHNPHWAVRAGAAEVLGRFDSSVARQEDGGNVRPADAGVLAALTAALNDSHPEVLSAVAGALQSIGAPDVEIAIPTLIRVLRDQRGPGHRAVAKSLAWIGLPLVAAAVPVLIDLLQDPGPGVRCSAADALGHLKILEAGDALVAMLDDAARDDQHELDRTPFEVRLIAADALAEIGASAIPPALPLLSAALPVLHAALREGDSSERGVALQALALLGPLAAETVPDLILVLGLRPVDWRAVKVLANLGPLASDAVNALEAALGDSDEYVRSRAATALGHIGLPSAGRAIPALLGLLDDWDNDVQECAAEALAKLGRIAPATN